jgi:hypothetical protein
MAPRKSKQAKPPTPLKLRLPPDLDVLVRAEAARDRKPINRIVINRLADSVSLRPRYKLEELVSFQENFLLRQERQQARLNEALERLEQATARIGGQS